MVRHELGQWVFFVHANFDQTHDIKGRVPSSLIRQSLWDSNDSASLSMDAPPKVQKAVIPYNMDMDAINADGRAAGRREAPRLGNVLADWMVGPPPILNRRLTPGGDSWALMNAPLALMSDQVLMYREGHFDGELGMPPQPPSAHYEYLRRWRPIYLEGWRDGAISRATGLEPSFHGCVLAADGVVQEYQLGFRHGVEDRCEDWHGRDSSYMRGWRAGAAERTEDGLTPADLASTSPAPFFGKLAAACLSISRRMQQLRPALAPKLRQLMRRRS